MEEPESSPLKAALERHLGRADGGERDENVGDDDSRFLLALSLSVARDPRESAIALDAMRTAAASGIDDDTLFSVAQAYGRAIGPIVDVEVELVTEIIGRMSPAAQGRALEAFLTNTLPLTTRLFETTHRARLRTGLSDGLLPFPLREQLSPLRAIAVVDVVGSTALMRDAHVTHDLIDALLEASESVAASQPVLVVKYAGDGVTLAGREPSATAFAARAIQERLARHEMSLVTHAGLAYGSVIRRAGDYFGFTVNLAHRLAEAAKADQLLAQPSAVEGLPGTEATTVELRGLGPTECRLVSAPTERSS